MLFIKLKSKRKISEPLQVYNLECSPIENYIANNMVVHNCYNSAYRRLYKGQKIVRYRSPANVIAECKEVMSLYKTNMFFFADDEFSMDIKRLIEIKDRYIKEIKLPFHCQIRIDLLDEQRVSILKEMGCYSLTFAIESGDEDIRKRVLNRKISDEQIIEGCKRLKSIGIKFRAENIIGLPNETFKQVLKTLDLNRKVKPDYAWCSLYQPFPGTVLGDYCRDNGLCSTDVDLIKEQFTEDTVLNMPQKDKNRLINLQRLFGLVVEFPLLRLVLPLLVKVKANRFYIRARNIWKTYCYDKRLFKL